MNLAALAEGFGLKLEKGAEEFLLKLLMNLLIQLQRKVYHLLFIVLVLTLQVVQISTVMKAKIQLSATSKPSSTPSSKKNSTESVTLPNDPPVPETAITIEDLLLGVDEVINYLPAGCGSVQNCRPAVKGDL